MHAVLHPVKHYIVFPYIMQGPGSLPWWARGEGRGTKAAEGGSWPKSPILWLCWMTPLRNEKSRILFFSKIVLVAMAVLGVGGIPVVYRGCGSCLPWMKETSIRSVHQSATFQLVLTQCGKHDCSKLRLGIEVVRCYSSLMSRLWFYNISLNLSSVPQTVSPVWWGLWEWCVQTGGQIITQSITKVGYILTL